MDSTACKIRRPVRVGGPALAGPSARRTGVRSRFRLGRVDRTPACSYPYTAWGPCSSWGAYSSSGGSVTRARQYVPVKLHRPGYEICKRLFDFGVCLILLPFVLPVIAVCAFLLFAEDPGPIFFRQMRTGKGGRRFGMYKLRTMVKNAEELKQKYMHLNELTWPDFKITNDPRVTRVGCWLRKTSLDELPQIFNVLLGQMSLVGPRPTSFSADTYELWHTERLEVVPGITGLWQVSGRSDVDFDDRLLLDVQYIENRSFLGDLKIIGATALAIFKQKGAY